MLELTGTCVPISWVEGLELLKMLDAQVLHCLSVGLMCWERFAANTLNVSTIFPSEMLAAQVLQCLSVGLMCWESFANTLYVSAIFPSDKLAAQVLLVCLHIGWFEVLEVLEGERCLDRCVSDYHPSRDVGFLVCRLVGFVVNTVVTSGGSAIL